MPPPDPEELGIAWTFPAIGTHWSIATQRPLGQRVQSEILTCIDDFDLTWSRFREGSMVRRMAIQPGTYDFGPSAGPLLDLYLDLYRRTGGLVTPLIGNALEHLGYDAGYSMVPRSGFVHTQPWEEAVTRQGSELTSTTSVTFDVGAAGKGYLVDLVLEVLRDNGTDHCVVDASGDLRHHGGDVQRVGLEHPLASGTVIGVANLSGNALCASAVNRRAWGDGLHHVVNPQTGRPARGVIATWVIAPTALVADGLATALFFVPAKALRGIDFSFVRMFAGGRIEYSANFDGELFG